MNKRAVFIVIFVIAVCLFHFEFLNSSEMPSPYARSSWPTIHRDSRNSDYLPFITTAYLKPKWHALKDEYSAVLTAVVIGPEGNIYFTTGKKEEYGNLHAFDREGNELWRSYLPDFGAFSSSPLVDSNGDLYLGDFDEFFGFHSDGSLKWKCPDIEGPFASSVFSQDGFIVGINKNGLVYVFNPQDGRLAASPWELPGPSPENIYKYPSLPGLWEGMIISSDEIADEAFSAFMGYQFKITNTPAVNPVNGRIYIVGTIRSEAFSGNSFPLQGRFYGFDFFPGHKNLPGEIQLAFQTAMGPGSGSSPAVSSNGSRIYALDGAGTLYAFNDEGKIIWTIQVNGSPASPAIGPDGTIYTIGGNRLCAVKDSGDSGTILWQKDFSDIFTKRSFTLPPSITEFFKQCPIQKINSAVRCNSVVSVSKNYLYLTLALGIEIIPEESNRALFLPTRCLLAVLSNSNTKRKQTLVRSLIALPDTTEGIITLDKDGAVFCTHASIASSIAYSLCRKSGIPFRKPTGGVTVLEPKYPQAQDLFSSY